MILQSNVRLGACDLCNAQNIEIAHGTVSGIETFYCAEGCEGETYFPEFDSPCDLSPVGQCEYSILTPDLCKWCKKETGK